MPCQCCLRVQAIMDKEDCTLEELMNEDDIIQECKAANGRLVALCATLTVIRCCLISDPRAACPKLECSSLPCAGLSGLSMPD